LSPKNPPVLRFEQKQLAQLKNIFKPLRAQACIRLTA
jgi:hypothetical protein